MWVCLYKMYVSVLKKNMLKAMAKNEDIKYCENEAFLEKPSSDMLKAKIFENQIIFAYFEQENQRV